MRSKRQKRTKRRVTKRRSVKKSKASRRRSALKASRTRCKNLLSKKISINMKELKKGKFKNRAQAIAVSYSQVSKKYPSCAKMFRR